MNMEPNDSSGEVSYLIYDSQNGKLVGRHRQYDITTKQMTAADENSVLARFQKDKSILRSVSENNPDNLAVLETSRVIDQPLSYMQVRNGQLLPVEKLVIYSDKDELEGDGEDSAQLTIRLQDENGKVVSGASNSILVTTSRGKLSARGGQLALKKGRATVTLTSVAETVNAVKVRVEIVDGLAEPAELTLAFV